LDLLSGFPFPLTLAVVGTGRGSGKTTVANALLQEGARKGIPLGIVPAGKGGNDTPLRVTKGTLVALAKNCEFTRSLEILEELPGMTPWGEILVGQARESAETVLAGPVCLGEIVRAARWLMNHGAQLVVVDGTLARWSITDTHLCQRYVLAMGADPAAPIARKENLERLRSLEEMPISFLPSPPDLKRPAWLQGERWKAFDSMDELKFVDVRKAEALFWPGALSDRVALALDRLPLPIPVVLEEPWRLLCSLERW
jgi:hypothetical protein